jgi:AraC-like DNA-binding protein
MWFLLPFFADKPTIVHVIVEHTLMIFAYALPGGLLMRHYLAEKAVRPAYKQATQILAAIVVEALLLVTGVIIAVTDTSPEIWLAFNASVISAGQILLAYYIIRRGPSRTTPELRGKTGSNGAINDVLVNWLPPLPGEQNAMAKLTRKAVEEHFHMYRPYIDPEFKLSQLATAMHVNRSEMSAFINSEFGMNFRRYVNRWRLAEYNRLMSLPSNERKSAGKIVSMAGFRDHRHYQRSLEAETQNGSADAGDTPATQNSEQGKNPEKNRTN